jgi:hypothetical protein
MNNLNVFSQKMFQLDPNHFACFHWQKTPYSWITWEQIGPSLESLKAYAPSDSLISLSSFRLQTQNLDNLNLPFFLEFNRNILKVTKKCDLFYEFFLVHTKKSKNSQLDYFSPSRFDLSCRKLSQIESL